MIEFPRRCRLDLNTSAELAIYKAIQDVEEIGVDERLTDIVIMLVKARDLLSDYVDSDSDKGLKEAVYTSIGAASMCWEETPKGEFDEQLANTISEKLCEDIQKLYGNK